MIRQALIIFALVFASFAAELILFNVFGRWFMPNLLVIVIVFINLYSGVRHALFAAVIAGILKDSYSAHIFGLNILSFIICAYMTTIIRRYYYEVGSENSRIRTVLLVVLINVCVQYVFIIRFNYIDLDQFFIYVLLPQFIVTSFVASLVFTKLKELAVKLSL
ncbi:MAG: rod shape-determining protein MreD [Omnitrophica WOR_2 bacterium GWA2_47_8]|nr:MAG: rod shape-determining protein MreD [Omnitrophica WOR_2 bacterium GWA2_47_8]